MSNTTTENDFDVIVIGSGIGSLTTASILARLNKKKVLVLEKHYEIGGLTHEFRRGPFSWDVGLHYVGRSVKEKLGLNIFDFITNGKLKWNSMGDSHEKFVFPDFSINVSKSRESYRQELIRLFPAEEAAIAKYFKDVKRGAGWFVKNYLASFFPLGLSWLLKLMNAPSKSLALMTTQEYLDKNIKDERLKAVLASRFGDYGLPPAKSAFCTHALVEKHYMDGGFFPDGGSEKIALYCEQVIENFGGLIMVNREVTQILTENGRALGVEVRDTNSPGASIIIKAPIVISGTGAWSTYNKLLPQTLNLSIQKDLSHFTRGYSAVSLFLGLKDSPTKLGITSANQWIYDTYDLNQVIEGSASDQKNDRILGLFLSFPSMKNNKGNAHTAEVISFVPHSLFLKWKDQPWKRRSGDYYQLKDNITENLLNLVEKHIPGFSDLISYRELATPLTIEHFTGREAGSLYGIPSTPDRFKLRHLRAVTPVNNLYLTGTDACTLGIMGGLLGGLAAASAINGPFGLFKIMKNAIQARKKGERVLSDQPDYPLKNATKTEAILVNKNIVKNKVYALLFETDQAHSLKPGQHVKAMVANEEWRSYTVEKSTTKSFSLLIDTKYGGVGARFFQRTETGTKISMRLPLTDFVFEGGGKDIIFFASSVGITAVIAILQKLSAEGFKKNVRLFFGAPTDNDIFVEPLLDQYVKSLGLKIVYCVDNPAPNSKLFHGTVTKAFQETGIVANEHEHYICGNPFMVQAVGRALRTAGATEVFW